jgi:hypothetical protein
VAALGIDVERRVSFRRDEHELAETLLLPGILDQSPAAAGDEKCLVAAQAVKEIDHGKLPRRLGIVAGR